MGIWIFILLSLMSTAAADAATRYVTNIACTGNYSVVNNNCSGTGSGLNSYTSIATAYAASTVNDTIRFRAAGSPYAITEPIFPFSGQTWEGCRIPTCATNETVTINGAGQTFIFFYDDSLGDGGNGANITIQYLTLTGTNEAAVYADKVNGTVLRGLTVTNWNVSGISYDFNHPHGLIIAGHLTVPSNNFLIEDCVIQNPNAASLGTGTAGISVGGISSNGIIRNNTIVGTDHGIWFDSAAGSVSGGFTAHLLQGNIVHDLHTSGGALPRIGVCFFIEARSSWRLIGNICYTAREGVGIRPGSSTSVMTGHRYWNNTIFGIIENAFWVPNENPSATFVDAEIKNNIFMNNSATHPTVTMATPYSTNADVIWMNNIIHNLGTGPEVCWNNPATGFHETCVAGGTTYNGEAGLDSWDTANTNVSQVGLTLANTAPLFAATGTGDFRLCYASGQPVAACTGASNGLNMGVNVGLSFKGSAPDVGAKEVICTAAIAGAPYAQSQHLCISFNFASHITLAPDTDNWPMTWADNGHQYASFGDGQGFNGTDGGTINRVSLGFARIEGTGQSYTGFNVWGGQNSSHPPTVAENPATFEGKSYGILAVGSTLWAWISPGSDSANYGQTRLATSTNRGASWTEGTWAFTGTGAQLVILPTIIQFGQNNSQARDTFMYSSMTNLKQTGGLSVQTPGEIVLSRVPIASPTTQANHQFISSFAFGQPVWTTAPATPTAIPRTPIFQDPNGVGWVHSIIYHPTFQRYILITEHTLTGSNNIGIFDAPEPWGPWTTILYENNWGASVGIEESFFWNFGPKWLQSNGDFTMVFTGLGDPPPGGGDAWHTIDGTLTNLAAVADIIAPGAPTDLRFVGP